MKNKYITSETKIAKLFLKNVATGILFFYVTFFTQSITAQSVSQTLNASGSWSVPAGVTSVTVQAWGGGGGGGGARGNAGNANRSGGGGGGGTYTINTVAVTPSSTINYVIGAGGTGFLNANGGSGGTTSFNSTIAVNAIGGNGGFANNGAGGAIATGITRNGGAGAAGTSGSSGGGGGSAGSGGNGGNASGTTAGIGGAGTSGSGAVGTTSASVDGATASELGGGGGGARSVGTFFGNGVSRTGGGGFRGQIIVTYTLPTLISFPTDGCTNSIITLNGTNFVAPLTVTFNGTAATSVTIISPTQINVLVPTSATTGNIRVTTATGFTTNAGIFTVNSNTLSGPSSMCIGTSGAFTPNSGGTWSSSDNTVATIDVNTGIASALSPGVTIFTFTDSATGCATSTSNINVYLLTSIISEPLPQSVCSGTAATFNVVASGGALTFQWYRGVTALTNSGNISGATGNTLTINPVLLSDAANNYYCIVTGFCTPAATSIDAALQVTQAVAINTQPIANQILCTGNTALFSVAATGAGLTYQWFNGGTSLTDGANISGALTPNLSISNLSTADASNSYYCVVSGTSPCNSLSSLNSILVVNESPSIGTQPASQIVCAGDNASLNILSSGGNLTYQWYKGAAVLSDGANLTGSGTNTLNFNPAILADNGTYHCEISNSCGMLATSNAILTVNQRPFIADYAVSVCSESAFVLIPANGVPTAATIVPAGTTYSWPAPIVTGGITGGTAQANQSGITDLLFNPTNTVQTATYTITPISGTSGNCAGASFTLTVSVQPRPFIVNLSPSICSGENLIVSPANGSGNIVPAGTTYSWALPILTGGITGGAGGTNQPSLNVTLNNPTNTVQTASYNVTATSGSCTGSVFTVAIAVQPKPTVAADLSTQTVCSGIPFSDITMSNPNNVAGTIDYNWTRNNTVNVTGMPASGNGAVISGTLINSTSSPQTVIFSLTATSDQSCISNPTTVSIIVNPVPTVAAGPATQSICSGNNISVINFSNPNAVSGTTYSWTRDNTANLTGIAASGNGFNISGNLINNTPGTQTTIFTISASANGCGMNTTTVSVTVNARPDIAALPLTQTVCGGIPISTIIISNPNAMPGTTFSWTRNNTLNLTGIAANGTGASISGTLVNNTNIDQITTFTINATTGGCPATPITVDVTVQPSPLAIAVPAVQSICTDTMASINFNTSNNLAGTTFSWTRDNTTNVTGMPASGIGDISGTLTNATGINQLTTFTIIATALNGCSKTITATVTVYPPLLPPNIIELQTVCAGSRPTPLLANPSISGGSGSYTYQWQSASGAGGPYANITGATAATYWPPTTSGTTPTTFYQVIVTNPCGTVTSNEVSVAVVNNLNFTFSTSGGGANLCPNQPFSPTITSGQLLPDSYIRYSWTADSNYITPSTGGPIGSTFIYYFFGFPIWAQSSATLPLTTINNTTASVTTTVFITPRIYDADTDAFICSLSPRQVSVTISPNAVPTITAPGAGTTICSASSAAVTMSSNLSGTFTLTRSVNVSVTSSTVFPFTSPTVAAAASYIFNDVLTNNTGVVQPVTYTVRANNANGCPGAQTTITINVAPRLLPGSIGSNQTICSGDDPAIFTETAAATGASQYSWEYSTLSSTGPYTVIAGATAMTYDAPGPITVTTWFRRVVSSSASGVPCSVATTTPVQVTVNNIAAGAIGTDQTICNGGDPALFSSTTAATGNGAISYQWQSNTSGCAGLFSNIGGAISATYDAPAGLLVTTYYRRAATSTLNGTPCTSYSNCITVTINNVTAGTVGSDETLCGTNPSAFTQTVAATGLGALSYQWQISTTGCSGSWSNIALATSATYDAPAGVIVLTNYRRMAISTLNGVSCTAFSNCITVTPNGVTAGAISGNRTVCLGGDPLAFTETAAASGTGLGYQWQSSTTGGAGPWTDIPGAVSATYDAPGPINQITYFRRMAIATVNSTSCTAASNFVTVFVNDVTPSVVAGNQSLCSNLDPAAFTISTGATGLGSLSYQWQSSLTGCSGPWINILGATAPTYDPPFIAQTTYYQVVVTSTLNSTPCSASSNCITVSSLAKVWNGSAGIDWNVPANWTPNGVPTASHCVVIPNTVVKPYLLGSNYVAYAYSLSILGGATLEIIPTNTLVVTDVVSVNAGATFLIRNNAALVQINNVSNSGNIDMERTTQPMYRYDYTYWGSPLTASSNFTLGALSPNTLSDKYFSWTPSVAGGSGNWVMETVATVMNPNRGYIARAPQTFSTNPAVTQPFTTRFVGTPNNGTINVPIAIGSMAAGIFDDKLNLLGNPYPSAVDADAFLSDAINTSLIDGTLYFWTHHSPPSAAYPNPFYGNYTYNYTAGDYATYTLLGGTNTVPTGYGGPTPNGFIAAGQGFFVKGLANGTAQFTNAMRAVGNNGSFFRNSQNEVEKHRIWLNLANLQGGFSQALIGYADGVTLGYDRGYDATAFSGNFVSFYSVSAQDRLTVQSRPTPFNDQDLIPLGFHATAANSYTIGIDHIDPLFDEQHIYLEDRILNVVHDLKQSPYTFASDAGVFDERFILRFTLETLDAQNFNQKQGVIAFIANGELTVQSSQNIRSITIFDLTGKRVAVYDGDYKKYFKSPFQYPQGIYLAKLRLEDDLVIEYKLINTN